MTKEQLMAMGLTEEQATKVMESLNGNFVTKNRFNEVNTELTNTKATIKERDGQLETLKKSTGDVEDLKEQIATLQKDNKAKDETHEAQIKQMKMDAAINVALSVAKARNPETVKPLLKAFLDNAELEGESIKGLDVEIKKLVEADETKFLFAEPPSQNKPSFRGARPGEGPSKGTSGAGSETPKTLYDAVKAAYQKDS